MTSASREEACERVPADDEINIVIQVDTPFERPFVASDKLEYASIADRILGIPIDNIPNRRVLLTRRQGYKESEVDLYIDWRKAKAPEEIEPDLWDSKAEREWKVRALEDFKATGTYTERDWLTVPDIDTSQRAGAVASRKLDGVECPF